MENAINSTETNLFINFVSIASKKDTNEIYPNNDKYVILLLATNCKKNVNDLVSRKHFWIDFYDKTETLFEVSARRRAIMNLFMSCRVQVEVTRMEIRWANIWEIFAFHVRETNEVKISLLLLLLVRCHSRQAGNSPEEPQSLRHTKTQKYEPSLGLSRFKSARWRCNFMFDLGLSLLLRSIGQYKFVQLLP